MFTGLVEAMGAITGRRPAGGHAGAILALRCPLGPLDLGESVSVEGACLTVKRLVAEGFEADVSHETLERTTLGSLPIGAPVNLERSIALGERLGGHLVTGHVDATCVLVRRAPLGEALALKFGFPAKLSPLIAEKGSVAVNGVSLTVNAVEDGGAPAFEVVIVPHTRDVTSLGNLKVGAKANLEVDLLARYVARYLSGGHDAGSTASADASGSSSSSESSDAAWLERLRRGGYV